ncbi:MAG TPA: DUF3137 domain-containing protein, partial [Anaerohalosphaeraceae bacterium]|nr:DUF3137 domain-containing protein [Anaerohalosphaeraceae bacterium]
LIGGGIFFAAAGRKYKQAFKQKIIGGLVRFIEPGLDYQPEGFIDQQTFEAAGLFHQHIDRYGGEDLVTGIVGKTQMAFSEVHAEYKTTTRTSKGHTQTHWHTIFKGLFFAADFNKHFRGRTIVLPDTAEKLFGGLGRMLQSWNIARADLVKLEDPEFEREFAVYGDDQIESRYILSTSLMQRILDFQKKAGVKISLSFVGSTMYAAVPLARDLFEPPYFSTPDSIDRIEDYYRDLMLAVGIVDDLNLNTRIWSKE